jgi:hypothetical protein
LLKDDVFVERSFTQGADKVRCMFFKPISDAQAYGCRFEIAWPDKRFGRTVWGVDAIQALLLAMRSAHDELRLRAEREGLPLMWLDGQALGLPPGGDTASDWVAGNEAAYYSFFLTHLSSVTGEAEVSAYSKEGAGLLRQAEGLFRAEFKERHPECWVQSRME